MIGVGDITGDGHADLVERDTTGTPWRNAGDGKGGLAPRVKIGAGYKGYVAIV